MVHPLVTTGLAGAGVGAATLAYALWEAKQFRLRDVRVEVLRPGSRPVRVLQLTDLHLTPKQEDKMAWVRSLADQQPDFVILTGDLLAHMDAVPYLTKTLEPLHGTPGVFVFGSNDYWTPKAINPFKYFMKGRKIVTSTRRLPTEDLEQELLNAGWLGLNNARAEMQVAGHHFDMRGSTTRTSATTVTTTWLGPSTRTRNCGWGSPTRRTGECWIPWPPTAPT